MVARCKKDNQTCGRSFEQNKTGKAALELSARENLKGDDENKEGTGVALSGVSGSKEEESVFSLKRL